MNKTEFHKRCAGAVYGDTDHGSIGIRLEIREDPNAHILGNIGIYLQSRFRGSSFRSVYEPNQSNGPNLDSRPRCERQLPKYQRWLDEWLAEHPPAKMIECCLDCNGPISINFEPCKCWC